MKTLSDCAACYEELAVALRKEKWFDERWQTTAGCFPNAEAPKSAFIQLFRDTWYNEEGKGIHLESWMTNADLARGTATVVLHVETSKARTGINSKAFVKALLDQVGAEIAGWEGYEIKPGYPMQPLTVKPSYEKEGFATVLRREFNRLVQIADAVDAAICEAKK